MTAPVRVLYVIDQLQQLGGAERNLLRLLRTLPRDRFEPHLLTFVLNREAFPSLPCTPLVYPIRQIYGWNGFRYAAHFRRLLRSQKFDIVHTFFESSDLWAAPLARLFSNAVLVSGRRDLGIQRHRFHDFSYRLLSPLYDQVQAVSDEVAHYLIRQDHLTPNRVVTIPNGIELDSVSPAPRTEVRARYGFDSASPVIVSLGNVRRVKGYDVLLKAAALVCRQFPQARFVIAGRILDNDHYQELLVFIAESGLGGSVQFLGAIEQVFDLLNAADIFFLPSHSEGMSNALLEAMACRLPAVATRVGGNPELIADGETGFLTPTGDAETAADRLLELLREPGKARTMGHSARLMVESRYSMEAAASRLVAEYERLLAARGR